MFNELTIASIPMNFQTISEYFPHCNATPSFDVIQNSNTKFYSLNSNENESPWKFFAFFLSNWSIDRKVEMTCSIFTVFPFLAILYLYMMIFSFSLNNQVKITTNKSFDGIV